MVDFPRIENRINQLKGFTIGLSFAIQSVYEDWRGFSSKLAELGRRLGFASASAFLMSVVERLTGAQDIENHVINLTGVGLDSSGRDMTGDFVSLRGSWGSGVAARRWRTKLETPIAELLTWNKSVDINVLYFVNNASPYSLSGYTVRTEAIRRAVEPLVDNLYLVTRLGYPAVIGKLPRSVKKSECIMLLPWIMPFRESKRREKTIKMLRNICLKRNVTILHTTTDFANAEIVSEVAHLLRIPWVYEVRGEPHNTWLASFDREVQDKVANSSRYKCTVEKEIECTKKANAVVVLSEDYKTKLVKDGVAPDKIVVLPNAVNEDFARNQRKADELRRMFHLGSGNIVGSISSLVQYEGLDILIRAIDHLPDNTQIVVVGEGVDSGRLRHIARETSAPERIHFLGQRPEDEMDGWYTLLDIFVLPRLDHRVCRNVTPIKPLQALAVGTPVVASDLPAIREVTGGFASYVVPEDPEALAKSIMASLGRDLNSVELKGWLKNRTWSSNGTKLSLLYRSLMLSVTGGESV